MDGIKYIGLDIAYKSIMAARERFPDKLFFNESWSSIEYFVGVLNMKRFLVVTMGTLEYFNKTELVSFFKLIRDIPGFQGIALHEPVNGIEQDILTQAISVPRGGYAFSHNYAAYLDSSGIRVEKIISNPSITQMTHSSDTWDVFITASLM